MEPETVVSEKRLKFLLSLPDGKLVVALLIIAVTALSGALGREVYFSNKKSERMVIMQVEYNQKIQDRNDSCTVERLRDRERCSEAMEEILRSQINELKAVKEGVQKTLSNNKKIIHANNELLNR